MSKRRPSVLVISAWLSPLVTILSAIACGAIIFASQKPIDYCQITRQMPEETSTYSWDISLVPFGVECQYSDRATGATAAHFQDWGTPFFLIGAMSTAVSLTTIFILIVRHNRRMASARIRVESAPVS